MGSSGRESVGGGTEGEEGFSLVELMVSLALAGLIGMAVSSFMTLATRVQTNAMTRDEFVLLSLDVAQMVATEKWCKDVFAGTPFNAADLNGQEVTLTYPKGTSSSIPVPLATAGMILGGLRIDSVKIRDTNGGVPVDTTADLRKRYLVELKVTTKKLLVERELASGTRTLGLGTDTLSSRWNFYAVMNSAGTQIQECQSVLSREAIKQQICHFLGYQMSSAGVCQVAPSSTPSGTP